MMPPRPSFSFSIPSIQNDLELNCRIYSPSDACLCPAAIGLKLKPRCAVVGHPYAPLGGCYDDPIVLLMVEELVKKGFIVGTFNFRGAGGSSGHTTWTGTAETKDYMSFIGLMYFYVAQLSKEIASSSSDGVNLHLTPVPSNKVPCKRTSSVEPQIPIRLLLSGYSYGALTTSHLPPTNEILALFTASQTGNAVSEIRLRAGDLATRAMKDIIARTQLVRGRSISQARRTPMTIGGEEGEPGSRRASREASARRSFDSVRRSAENSRRRLMKRQPSIGGDMEEQSRSQTGTELPVQTAYLLISPLLGPIASLATMSLLPQPHSRSEARERKFIKNPTLVIYGDADSFTSKSRTRKWCQAIIDRQQQMDAVQRTELAFQQKEIVGAGHFWREDHVEEELRRCIVAWVGRFTSSNFFHDVGENEASV